MKIRLLESNDPQLLKRIEKDGLDRISQKLKVKIPNYVLKFEKNMPNSSYANQEVKGLFDGKNIKIEPDSPYEEQVGTFVHEVGHLLHHTYLNDEDMGLIRGKERASGKNAQEKFAYAFQDYIMDGDGVPSNNSKMKQILSDMYHGQDGVM